MGPAYVIDVFEHIGDMKRDNSHCIAESLVVEMFISSALEKPQVQMPSLPKYTSLVVT